MNFEDIDKEEIIKAAVTLAAVAGSEFENEFPDLNKWAKIHATPEEQNRLVGEMIDKIQKDKNITITQDTFFTLYAYVQAVLGLEGVKIRFPKLRSIALNLAEDESLAALLLLVKQIEDSIHEKYSK